MKRLQTTRWLKLLAGVLCVAALTTAAACLGPADQLARLGAYRDISYEAILSQTETELLQEQVNNAASFYIDRLQGSSWGSLEEYADDPNFFCTIKDEQGRTLAASEELGDYRAKYRETFWFTSADAETATWSGEESENSPTEYTVTITGFIRADLQHSGNIYQSLSRMTGLLNDRYLYLGGLIGSSLLGLLCLAYLTWSAGRRREEDLIALGWLDEKVPTDVLAVLGLLLVGFAFSLLDQMHMPPLDLALMAGSSSLLLVVWLSLVRRGKARVLGQDLLLRRLGRPGRWAAAQLRRLGRAILRAGHWFSAKLPLIWQAGLLFLVCAALEALWIGMILCGNNVLILWIILKGIEAAGIVYLVLAMRTLEEGARELAAGNLDHQIDLEKLPSPFRPHAQHLNSMRTAIQTAVEDQLKSERMKTELITNVSHDIKTPLTSIVNYVDLLKKQEMPNETAREYVAVLDRQSAKLKKLTEDLVEAAKASTGSMTVDFQRTDVNVLLTQSTGEYQERLQSKGLTLLLTPGQDAPAISADGRLLWRVFENLLSNVYKYALPGTRVYLTCQAGEDQVVVTCRNISAEPLNISADELMERFVRGDTSRHTEGSGLGLSIARSLTQLQHGRFDLAIDGDLFKVTLTFPRLP